MAKFCGNVGFIIVEETEPGIWEEKTEERQYYGDVLRSNFRASSSSKMNDDITLSSSISIVSDIFADNNFQWMRYVEYNGVKWKITEVEPLYPRLILTIGGVYNAA